MMYKPDFSHKLIQADATSKCNGFFAKFGKKLTYRSIFLHKHQQKNDTAVPFLFFLVSAARAATAMVTAAGIISTAGIATAATRRTIASRGYNRRERGRSERCGRCECAAVGQIVEIERI